MADTIPRAGGLLGKSVQDLRKERDALLKSTVDDLDKGLALLVGQLSAKMAAPPAPDKSVKPRRQPSDPRKPAERQPPMEKPSGIRQTDSPKPTASAPPPQYSPSYQPAPRSWIPGRSRTVSGQTYHLPPGVKSSLPLAGYGLRGFLRKIWYGSAHDNPDWDTLYRNQGTPLESTNLSLSEYRLIRDEVDRIIGQHVVEAEMAKEDVEKLDKFKAAAVNSIRDAIRKMLRIQRAITAKRVYDYFKQNKVLPPVAQLVHDDEPIGSDDKAPPEAQPPIQPVEPEEKFLLQKKGDKSLFWAGALGWMPKDQAEKFSASEKDHYEKAVGTPDGMQWVSENDPDKDDEPVAPEDSQTLYVIQKADSGWEFWSQSQGWVDIQDADKYTEKQKQAYEKFVGTLPGDRKWVPYEDIEEEPEPQQSSQKPEPEAELEPEPEPEPEPESEPEPAASTASDQKYVIRNSQTGLFFQDNLGWVDFGQASVYTQDDKEENNLPAEGEWVPYEQAKDMPPPEPEDNEWPSAPEWDKDDPWKPSEPEAPKEEPTPDEDEEQQPGEGESKCDGCGTVLPTDYMTKDGDKTLCPACDQENEKNGIDAPGDDGDDEEGPEYGDDGDDGDDGEGPEYGDDEEDEEDLEAMGMEPPAEEEPWPPKDDEPHEPSQGEDMGEMDPNKDYCSLCDQPFAKKDGVTDKNGFTWCPTCQKEMICNHCHKSLKPGDEIFTSKNSNALLCSDCADDEHDEEQQSPQSEPQEVPKHGDWSYPANGLEPNILKNVLSVVSMQGSGTKRKLKKKGLDPENIKEVLHIIQSLKPHTDFVNNPNNVSSAVCYVVINKALQQHDPPWTAHPDEESWDLVELYMKVKGIKDRKKACGPDELDLQPPQSDDDYEVDPGGEETDMSHHTPVGNLYSENIDERVATFVRKLREGDRDFVQRGRVRNMSFAERVEYYKRLLGRR